MTIAERATRILSLIPFREANAPEPVREFDLICPFERQYILRMLVKQPNLDLTLPPELEWLRAAIFMCQHHQESMGIRQPYLYVTVRHGEVTSVTDDLWHVDGFSTKITHIPEQNYLWVNREPTECAMMATEFPSDFDPLVHNIHLFFQKRVREANLILKAKTFYCMDPYVIHRRPQLPTGTHRTFVRFSFTPIPIADINNTKNPLMPFETFGYDGIRDFRNQLRDYDLEKS